MKKLTSSKAKLYAQRLYTLEKELKKTSDKTKINDITIKINNIVDEIVENYDHTAMYRVDDEVYKLAAKDKKTRESEDFID